MPGLRLWYWFWSLCTWGWNFSLSLWGTFLENGNTRASLDLGPTWDGGAGAEADLELWAMGPAWLKPTWVIQVTLLISKCLT